MYAVMVYDDGLMDDVVLFEGTLDACTAFADGDEELFIVAPDGFTVVG